MATKYHVNPETGRANKCEAHEKPCKFGENLHGDTKEAARTAYEKHQVNETVPDKLKKSVDSQRTLTDAQIDRRWELIEEVTEQSKKYEREQSGLQPKIRAMDDAAREYRKLQATLQRSSNIHDVPLEASALSNMVDGAKYLSEAGHPELIATNNFETDTGKLASAIEEIDKAREQLEHRDWQLNNAINLATEQIMGLTNILEKETGYRENPRYGVPTGQTTDEVWAGKRARNYSSLPIYNVPVLKDSERYCTKCDQKVIVVQSKTSYAHFEHENGDGKCGNGVVTPNSICQYCGTGDASKMTFSQQSWHDEISCSRCGGRTGWAIGD